jgi:hypothetical protein
MKRFVLCALAFLLVLGSLVSSADAYPCAVDCVSWCQSQGYDDGVCSVNRPYQCVCLYIG